MSLRLAGPQGSAFFMERRLDRSYSDATFDRGVLSVTQVLAQRKCRPCEGGVDRLEFASIDRLLEAF